MSKKNKQQRSGRIAGVLGLAALVAAAAIAFLAWPRPIMADLSTLPETTVASLADRGAYIARAAGCVGCHTMEVPAPTAATAEAPRSPVPFAGGRPFKTPFGVFYSPNITSDTKAGIGGWSDAQFRTAMRHGVDDAGQPLYPVFPYGSYTLMTDEDVLALHVYLRTVPASDQVNIEHRPMFPLSWRPLLNGWRLLFLKEGPFRPDPARDAVWNRGAYLVEGLSHCAECHTPRNVFGALDRTRWLAGTRDGPDGEKVPNLTPDATGLAEWSTGDIVTLLKTGAKPDYDNVQGSMAEAIHHGLSYLTDDDLQAIAIYLKALPPVSNKVR
jgi:mono/diheme cytochrome c family protein